jgi:hypothetical protein
MSQGPPEANIGSNQPLNAARRVLNIDAKHSGGHEYKPQTVEFEWTDLGEMFLALERSGKAMASHDFNTLNNAKRAELLDYLKESTNSLCVAVQRKMSKLETDVNALAPYLSRTNPEANAVRWKFITETKQQIEQNAAEDARKVVVEQKHREAEKKKETEERQAKKMELERLEAKAEQMRTEMTKMTDAMKARERQRKKENSARPVRRTLGQIETFLKRAQNDVDMLHLLKEDTLGIKYREYTGYELPDCITELQSVLEFWGQTVEEVVQKELAKMFEDEEPLEEQPEEPLEEPPTKKKKTAQDMLRKLGVVDVYD